MANHTENYNLVKPTMAETADIRTLNGNMDTVDTIMHDTQVSMADAFDSTETYAIRDKVMYEFKLYQCIHPHTGPWDANNWERVNAADTGGNYVEITPTYNSGMKVADTNIDGDLDEIKVPYMTGATAQADGAGGVVPAPTSQDVGKYLDASGGWSTPSGGGGGSNYSETVLWSGENSATMTLSESFENYDAILFIGEAAESGIHYVVTNTWSVEDLKAHINEGSRLCAVANDAWYEYITIPNDSTFIRENRNILYISEIRGLNLGGGKGSEIIPITAGDGTTSRTFTFDRIPKKVSMQYVANGWGFYRDIIWGTDRSYYQASQATISDTVTYTGVSGIVCDETTKSITITGLNATQAANTTDIVGYMYVEYGAGGGSGGARKDVLYSDANGAPHLTWLQLTHNFDDYDEIFMKISNPTDISAFNLYTYHSFMPMMYDPTERVSIQGLYGQRVVDVMFNGASFEIVRTDGDFRDNTIYEIVGIKY